MIATKATLVEANKKVVMTSNDGTGYALKPTPCRGFVVAAGGQTFFLPFDLLFPSPTPKQKKLLDTLFPAP